MADDEATPTFTIDYFSQVLAAENEWSLAKAREVADEIRISQGWAITTPQTEATWIWAAVSWWSKNPVEETKKGRHAA